MKKILVVSVLLIIGVTLVGAGNPADQAVQRPIEDFVDRQGRWCIPLDWNLEEAWYQSDPCTDDSILFVPPIANFLGWFDPNPENLLAMSVDYAGLGGNFGTEFSGTVTERPLPDGRAEVHVRLNTGNALTWVVEGHDFNGTVLFGTRWDSNGNVDGKPTLGESFLDVVLINTAPGEPLPDLMQLVIFPEPGQELIRIAFNAAASGPLQEAFGVPEGTPGRAMVVQRGLFMTPFMGAVGDGFPVERIELHVVGQ